MVTYADILSRNINIPPKKKTQKFDEDSLLCYCSRKLHECRKRCLKVYEFVNSGGQRELDKRLMTGGKKRNQDGHSNEDLLLRDSGMSFVTGKNKKRTCEVVSKCKVTNKYKIKSLINGLSLVVHQRLNRHCHMGHKDRNNPEGTKRHRKAIGWFITAMENVMKSLY